MAERTEHISEEDFLNDGRVKINKFAIDPALRAEQNSNNALNIASDSKEIANNTDDRLDNVLAGEIQDGEVIDARKPFGDTTFDTLGNRLDYQIGKNIDFREFESDNSFMTRVKNEQTERGINVKWFSNSENPLQAAIDSAIASGIKRVIMSNWTIDEFAGVTIGAVNGLEIIGSNVTLKTTSPIVFFRPIGSLKNVTIRGFNAISLVESSNYEDFPTFFGNSSSENFDFDFLTIEDNEITNVKNGISLNANLTGHVRDSIVRRNKITKTNGSVPGTGYGIHLANGDNEIYANNLIYSNVIEETTRHAIYQARGNGTKIYGNLIRNHRLGEQSSALNSALAIARSRNVDCYNNTLVDCYSLGIAVNPDVDEESSVFDSKNIKIYKNNIYSTKYSAIQIGVDGVGVGDRSSIDIVNVTDNTILQTNAMIMTAESLGFKNFNCKNLYVSNNTMYFDNSTVALNYGLQLATVSEFGVDVSPEYSYNWNFKENNIRFETPENARGAFRLNNVRDTMVDIVFDKNKKNTVLSMFSVSSAITNPNIEIIGNGSGATFAATVVPLKTEFKGVYVQKIDLAGTYANPLKMGSNYLWFASDGKLMRKSDTTPSSQADGIVLG